MKLSLVLGGSSSGKSEYAELLAVDMATRTQANLVYIATMDAKDGESLKRIEAHRKRRAGRGFVTIEKARNLSSIEGMEGAVILLEDLSNLAANELFVCENEVYRERNLKAAFDDMIDGINHLRDRCCCLIAVTNDIFEDVGVLQGSMLTYTKLLGSVNSYLAREADQVTELICGVPMNIKPNGKNVAPAQVTELVCDDSMRTKPNEKDDVSDQVTELVCGDPKRIKPNEEKVTHGNNVAHDKMFVNIGSYTNSQDIRSTSVSGQLEKGRGTAEDICVNPIITAELTKGMTQKVQDDDGFPDNQENFGIKAGGSHLKVVFVTGGFCQDKTEFARSKAADLELSGMGHVVVVDDFQDYVRTRLSQKAAHETGLNPDAESVNGEPADATEKAIYNAQLDPDAETVNGELASPDEKAVRTESCGEEQALTLLERLGKEGVSAAVIVSALPCSGPVPADPFERRWRDEVGKASQVLASHATEIYRIICGIPQRLR